LRTIKYFNFFCFLLTIPLFLAVLVNAQILPPVDIPVINIPQKTKAWCWVAVSQQIIMFSQGLQRTPPQCALVAIANNAPPEVCSSGYNPLCVRPGSIRQIQKLIAYFGGRYTTIAPPTDPLTIYRTLASGRPIILQVKTGIQSGHVVVLRGMSFIPRRHGIEPVLHINDPSSYFTKPVPFLKLLRLWISAIVVH